MFLKKSFLAHCANYLKKYFFFEIIVENYYKKVLTIKSLRA